MTYDQILATAPKEFDFSTIEPKVLIELEKMYREEAMVAALNVNRLLETDGIDTRFKERSNAALGSRVLSVPIELALMARKQGETYADPSYRKWTANRYDGVRVEAGGTRIQSGYNAGGVIAPPTECRKRIFTKTYA